MRAYGLAVVTLSVVLAMSCVLVAEPAEEPASKPPDQAPAVKPEQPPAPPAATTPAPPAPAPSAAPAPPGAEAVKAVVTAVKGSVEYRTGTDKPWQPLAQGTELSGDSEISTGLNGEAVINIGLQAEVTVKRLTQVRIAELAKTDKANVTHLEVKYGALKAKVEKGTVANDFRVKTASFSLSVTGTDVHEIKWYRGFGGTTTMGNTGVSYFAAPAEHYGAMSLRPTEETDDQLTEPAWLETLNQRTNTGMPGYPMQEYYSAVFRNVPRLSSWELIRPDNPAEFINRFGPQEVTPPPVVPPQFREPQKPEPF